MTKQTTKMYLFLLVSVSLMTTCSSLTRKYYIAAEEIMWNYDQGDGGDFLFPGMETRSRTFFESSANRIGSMYKKTVYVQYTDDTFTVEMPKPSYMGFVGPIIRGGVGDVIAITFFNKANGTFSIHPHGVFYYKDSEGALYLDGTSGVDRLDDHVAYGETVHMTWNVTERDAPTEADPPCLPWIYHSHVDTVRDTSAGLLGVMVTCKKGILNDNNERTDVDREYPLVFRNMDETLSWHLEENMERFCLEPEWCRQLDSGGDFPFMQSNIMMSINGQMYAQMKGLEACVRDRVQFYIIGFGNSNDVHSVHFHGQNMRYQHTRGDTVSVYSATFVAADMVAKQPGFWLISDMVDSNEQDGMLAIFTTKHCNRKVNLSEVEDQGSTRHYFLAAEEVTWDYGPSGYDIVTGERLTADGSESKRYFTQSTSSIGGVYKKAKFVGYTDDTFSTQLKSREHLGILGPVLRAEVGDTLKVTVNNRLPFPVSVLPHALSYVFTEESMYGLGLIGGGVVLPGGNHTYTFHVPGDLLNDVNDNCHNFIYTSVHDPSADHNTGLVGPVLVCRKGHLKSEEEATDEFFLLFSITDENKSHYMDENIDTYVLPDNETGEVSVNRGEKAFQGSNLMNSINGLTYGNLPSLNFCLHSEVTWYIMALGDYHDLHTVTFDGNTFSENGKTRSGRGLVAGNTAALHMVMDNPGRWVLGSYGLLTDGMFAVYNVEDCRHGNHHHTSTTSDNNYNNKDSSSSSRKRSERHSRVIRRYYIAAIEMDWDYAPLKRSIINGENLTNPDNFPYIFFRNDDQRYIGSIYKKAVFRGFTDASFTTPLYHSNDSILGPHITAEVGDTILVTFKNMASRPYSIHANGVKTSQSDSGLNYGSSIGGVDPGHTHTYKWDVPSRSGPGDSDPNCIPWLYYSAMDPIKDVHSGLIGALVICRPGILDSEGKRRDVDQELYLAMSVISEMNSWYLEENVRKYAPARIGTDYEHDYDFRESNHYYAVNGYTYGNNPDLVVEYNSSVVWYFMNTEPKASIHTIHLHGHTVVHSSEQHRDDVMQMFAGTAEAAEMVTDNAGTWLLHCHLLFHIQAGMETTYTVLEPGEKASDFETSPNIHLHL